MSCSNSASERGMPAITNAANQLDGKLEKLAK
jgi:hypothetical protein